MHPKALFELAVELVGELMRFERPADGTVASFLRRHRRLGPRERHVLAETAFAILRRRLLFEHLARAGPGPLVRRLTALGWAGDASLLSASLDADEHRWLEAARATDPSALPEATRHNLPEWIAQPLARQLGDEFWSVAASLDAPAPLDLRVNVMKVDRAGVQASLAQADIAAAATPYSPWGLRVQGKPALGKVDVYRRGEIEVQDEGSQLLALLVDARRGQTVVDFCAGGGGKTLALGVAMRNTGRLYALDIAAHRLEALKPRLARGGLSNVYTMQIAHERDERLQRLAGKADRVLVDAPCSGLGSLRRNPDLKWRQSAAAVREFAVRQAQILASAARLLKPDGRLVYATCSLLEEENEAVAAAFAVQHRELRLLEAASVLSRLRVERAPELASGPFLRLWPHRHETDGFFAAAWQRETR
jgi:16S rRNA (cytosine967-C5)-methyltransferase